MAPRKPSPTKMTDSAVSQPDPAKKAVLDKAVGDKLRKNHNHFGGWSYGICGDHVGIYLTHRLSHRFIPGLCCFHFFSFLIFLIRQPQ
jgi:hypothetical protein